MYFASMTEGFKNDFLQHFISEILNFCFAQKLVSHRELTFMYAKMNVHVNISVYGLWVGLGHQK